MASIPRSTSSQSSSAPLTDEARGLQRLLSRLKTTLSRRNSNSRPIGTPSNTSIPIPTDEATQADPTISLGVHSSSISDPPNPIRSRTQLEWDNLLTVDDEENIPDVADEEEATMPLSSVGRAQNGMAEAKTRQLFERHNLTYHARAASLQEPMSKVRRVERPIRMRVRWTCHSCRTVFGQDKYCTGCGHRRCFSCERDPPRRIKIPAPDDMRQEPESRLQTPTSSRDISQFIPSVRPTQDQGDAHGAEARPWRCTIQIGQPRPDCLVSNNTTSALTPIDISTQAPRRDCHECEASTESIDLTDCPTCGHPYCVLCPTYNTTNDNQSSQRMHLNQVPVVQRVYRKPRQRVRFHCEHCNVQYTNRNDCTGCGHERCENCPRFPPRKRKLPVDPVAWQALEAKVARQLSTTENDDPLHGEQPQL